MRTASCASASAGPSACCRRSGNTAAPSQQQRAMGLFALPNILIFQMLLPLVSPFIDLMFLAGIVHYFIDRHFHPEAASAASFQKLLIFFLAFLVIDFVTSALAFALETQHPANKGDGWLLFHIWLQRFTYRQFSRWCCSRPSSEPSTASPSTGTNSTAPRRCPSRPSNSQKCVS